MKRTGVLLADLFDERGFLYPYHRVREAGYAPTVLGLEAREYRAKSGFASWGLAAKPRGPRPGAGGEARGGHGLYRERGWTATWSPPKDLPTFMRAFLGLFKG
ncbi:glutamine amidotransferase [Thermus thermophilus]|uniref:hypothetical protein n=1 Tax=Thermus thermophilus TaxID=274 RepID=UPI00090B4BE9|nr:hypothetical protein [Thermus thermophilus]BAW01967.1 glutamine amidotransferase [Thermus thermophilus]BDB12550.1 hypothetical protein TthTMY_22890 [Thermus thermophilus]